MRSGCIRARGRRSHATGGPVTSPRGARNAAWRWSPATFSMAIAAGACQGLGLGSNALAALITRGLAEMARLAVALGARSETLSGLAGLGDLVLTCTGSLSRNRFVGIELGKGRALGEILANMRMVAEGVHTTEPLLALAREHQIEMPITEQVNAILHAGKSPQNAIREIMERPLKRE